MMGTKVRAFVPVPRETSLEDLVPEDNFYRRLEERLDLSFVRELVRPLYAGAAGRRLTRWSSSSSNSSCPSTARGARGSSCGWWPTDSP